MTNPLDPGVHDLYDALRPPLTDGSYRLTASTSATFSLAGGEPETHALTSPPLYFDVTGPRYALSPDDVVATMPPRNAEGAFADRLPQIVLRRPTLPWEREVASAPWLALVLVDQAECTPVSTPLVQLFGPGAPDGNGDSLTLPPARLAALLPTVRELSLLAHVRRAGDEQYAILVCNRLPQPGGAYHACVVSLEGRESLVVNPAAAPAPVTLPLLYRWSFRCTDVRSFESYLRALTVGAFGFAKAVPSTGHVTLAGHARDGQPRTVYYRGPLAPYSVERDPTGPYYHASELRRTETPDGQPAHDNVAYEVAFELGRLIASADGSFAQAVQEWRSGSATAAARTREHSALMDAMPSLASTSAASTLAPRLTIAALRSALRAPGPIGDPYQTAIASRMLDLATLHAAWGVDEATLTDAFGATLLDSASVVPLAASTLTIDELAASPAEFGSLTRTVARITGEG